MISAMNSSHSFPTVATNAFVMQPQPSQFILNHHHKMALRESASSSSSSNSSSSTTAFPCKLHAMLSDAAAVRFDDVVCWLPGGQAFKVLDVKRFSEEIMPQYFNQSKYKSFQRQLNIYGFLRVHHGPQKGGYTHKCLVQGYPDLAEQIKREGSSSSSAATSGIATTTTTQDLINKNNSVMPAVNTVTDEESSPPPALIDPIQPFAWDVEAEAAFGGDDDFNGDLFQDTIDEIAAFSSLQRGDFNVDPTPIPFHAQQHQQRQRPSLKRHSFTKSNTVLNSEDMAFFKNLFQPGDSATQEKEILDSFFIEQQQQQQQQRQPVVQAPPAVSQQQQFFQPVQAIQEQYHTSAQHMVTPTPVQQETAPPLLTTGAVSEYNFPRKLYRLLQDCESNPEYRSIVSWNADGTSFKVHCKKRFVSIILPNYFDQTQYASFRRQLNMYSFLRQSMSTYANPNFMRGHRELLDNVVRENGNGSTAATKKSEKAQLALSFWQGAPQILD